jgi:hypothetical protein
MTSIRTGNRRRARRQRWDIIEAKPVPADTADFIRGLRDRTMFSMLIAPYSARPSTIVDPSGVA